MALWGFRWLRFFLNPYHDDFGHISEEDRRVYMLGRLENAKISEWSWVVIVAGVGFFTDAYSIFAINMVTPILGIVYYPEHGGTMPHSYEIALSVVTLGGSIIGQVAFGLAADLWGRRKMYGLELMITIGATIGVVMSSNGVNGSMSVMMWLLIWRFWLGIGIGADYPLSAVICSEFAPTAHRGKMLTAVFSCQPLGQLAATLVSLIAVVRQRDGIPGGSTIDQCKESLECLKTLDSVWRWIIGVGIIPAVIALWFRLTIIESPRYTADVGGDSKKAVSELNRYQGLVGFASSHSLDNNRNHTNQEVQSLRPASSRVGSSEEIRRSEDRNRPGSSGGTSLVSGVGSEEGDQMPYTTEPESMAIDDVNGGIIGKSPTVTSMPFPPGLEGMVPAGQSGPAIQFVIPESHREEGAETPPPPSWKDFKTYFWHDGNLRTLIATSLCWFYLDLPFYGLGMNSPRIITTIWHGDNPPIVLYDILISNVWQSLVVVSLGALTGCAVTFFSIDILGRRLIQMIGFFWLFILFIIIGGSFHHLVETKANAAIIVLYILCQIFFNFGPNTTTYIMPAEIFPTRYRGLCHGISAAFGKLGSVIAQLFLAYINYGNGVNYNNIDRWLPYSLLIFSIFMLLGLYTTHTYLHANEYAPNGRVKTLEQWAVGRETPNRFSQHRLAKLVERIWKRIVRVSKRIERWLEWAAGDKGENGEVESTIDNGEREIGGGDEQRREMEMDELGREGFGEGDTRDEGPVAGGSSGRI